MLNLFDTGSHAHINVSLQYLVYIQNISLLSWNRNASVKSVSQSKVVKQQKQRTGDDVQVRTCSLLNVSRLL